jgi:hypothetical protein
VLKLLANGRNLDFASAANPHLTAEQVREVAQSHGYPNVSKVRQAIAVIEDRQARDEVASLPSALGRESRPSLVSVAATPTPKSVDETADLLKRAAASPKARQQALARKITLDLKRLRDLFDADEAAARQKKEQAARREAEKRARERARQQVREEVARLEAELKAARARLRGNRAVASVKAAASGEPSESARIRAWCAENGVEVNANGRIPAKVREQYEAAQEAAS